MTDWREAAKGIPLIPGGLCYAGGLTDVRVLWVEDTSGEARGAQVRHRYGEAFVQGAILALNDPDTRAAYVRRLALELGCPDDGRLDRLFRVEMGNATGYAGHLILSSDRWREAVPVGTTDLLLALALAWPADKRVSHG